MEAKPSRPKPTSDLFETKTRTLTTGSKPRFFVLELSWRWSWGFCVTCGEPGGKLYEKFYGIFYVRDSWCCSQVVACFALLVQRPCTESPRVEWALLRSVCVITPVLLISLLLLFIPVDSFTACSLMFVVHFYRLMFLWFRQWGLLHLTAYRMDSTWWLSGYDVGFLIRRS